MREKFKDEVLDLERVVNTFSLSSSASTDEMAREMYVYMHPTNLQTFMRLSVSVRRMLAEQAKEKSWIDDRYRASHKVAEILMEGHDDLPGLPFI